MPERLEGHRENGSTSAHASLGGRKCTEIQQSHRNTTTWERILQTMAQTGKMCLCARLTLDSSKSTPEVLPAAEAVSMWIHSIPSYPVPAFICSVYLSFFHCELLKGICSKTPSGCLKLHILSNPIYTMFFPIHTNL
nr:uncharacterized protein LOC123285185 isoform X11 [Equus asinus]